MTQNTFREEVLEGVRKSNTGEFQKVLPATSAGDSSLVMFKVLQTLSNLHDVVADMYTVKGEESLANLHFQLANRVRSEALKARNESQSK